MIFKNPLQRYLRASQPPNPTSIPQYTEEEFKKLERTLASMADALKELAAKVP